MTVSYTAEVATARHFGCFWKLLRRWRASIYKIIWCDLLVFLFAFYAMAVLYRYLLNESDKRIFEDIVNYCYNYGSLIPLSFVLGFYVSIILERWWKQYITVPWPDPLAVYVSALVRGQDEHGRLMRRTIMRYVCLSLTMVLTMISPGIKRRFPNYDFFVEAGLLNRNEERIISKMDEKFPKHSKYWMPIVWASSIMTRARKEGRIWDDFSLKSMIDELNKFRAGCNLLINYDMISVPLVYTQVVTLAVYTYFLAAIFGHQCINKDTYDIVNYYFPVFSTLEFFFFMGWLKVAETLICPFGDDDDDFDLNWVIDRNLQVSYLIVDEMHNDHPTLVRDQYWDEVFPNELPYTHESQRQGPPEASTAKLNVAKITSSHVPKLSRSTTSERDFTNFDGEDDYNTPNELRIKFASRFFNIHRSSSSISYRDFSPDTPDFGDELDEETEISQPTGRPPTRETSKDDFDRLREERERERHARQLHHAAMTFDLLKGELTNPPESGNHSEAGSIKRIKFSDERIPSSHSSNKPSSSRKRESESQTDKTIFKKPKE